MIVAIGANLPGPDGAVALAGCERAVRAIAELPEVSAVVRSRWYSTAPVPPSGQPRYVNGAVRFACGLPPGALLAALQGIERGAGRMRTVANAARTLDLDIIDMAGVVRWGPDPVLPHPRAHERRFVLLPVRDVAPRWIHPVLRLEVEVLLAALREEDIVPQ